MRPRQRLLRVELPLAAPLIMAGVRISVIVNVATATIGAVANAGGLGAPIINGLVNLDPAVTLEGAVLVAGLALILDAFLVAAERVMGSGGETPRGLSAHGAGRRTAERSSRRSRIGHGLAVYRHLQRCYTFR